MTADAAVSDGPTPPQDQQPTGVHASYVPHDLRYNPQFEDSLIQIVLDGSDIEASNGIRIIPSDSDEHAKDGLTVRAQDISSHSLPTVIESELPLPLGDSRRTFASPVSGLRLTHPGGYLQGGPGLDPTMDTFPDEYLANHSNITTPEQLRGAIDSEIHANLELLRQRLRARQKAKDKNEQIEKELKALKDQHSMELKIHNRMQEDNAKKKEAKEKRRAEKRAG